MLWIPPLICCCVRRYVRDMTTCCMCWLPCVLWCEMHDDTLWYSGGETSADVQPLCFRWCHEQKNVTWTGLQLCLSHFYLFLKSCSITSSKCQPAQSPHRQTGNYFFTYRYIFTPPSHFLMCPPSTVMNKHRHKTWWSRSAEASVQGSGHDTPPTPTHYWIFFKYQLTSGLHNHTSSWLS